MLHHLTIRNFATIKKLELEFQPEFSILTGETGAGKTIVIDAIMLIRGDRANAGLVRSGEEKAEVEAMLTVPDLEEPRKLLDEAGILAEEELIVRCLLPLHGRPRRFVNGVSVTADFLKKLNRSLINIYGQHEHQTLLKTSSHLDYLDSFAGLTLLREKVHKHYLNYRSLLEKQEVLNERLGQRRLRIEELDELVEELNELALETGEEEKLQQEGKILGHAGKLHQLLGETLNGLQAKDNSLIEQLEFLRKNLHEANGLDPDCGPLLNDLEHCLFLFEDLGSALEKRHDAIEENPDRLGILNERLNRIQRLQRKYQLTQSDQLLELHQSAKQELMELMHLEENGHILEQQLVQVFQELQHASESLSKKRRNSSKDMDQKIEQQLHQLGMEKARFRTHFHPQANPEEPFWSVNGIDRIEFLISVNPGQELKSLTRVASGGELSRTMLALKTILQSHDPSSVLIFDEVDTGISGRIAEIVGRKLRSLGKQQQTLCVTHHPQIAAFSNHHYVVRKNVNKVSTYTSVHLLITPEEKAHEIALLIGGEKITEKTLGVAVEMLEQAQKRDEV